MRIFAVLLTLVLGSSAFAMEGDLVLPDARFGGLYNKLICNSFDESGVAEPTSLTTRKIKFEKLLVDGMVLQFLVAANFQEGDSNCRYSALFKRAAKNTMILAESKVFAIDGTSNCAEGKKEVDALFPGKMPFTYTKNPIRFVALKIMTPTATEVCGENATHFRVVFERVRNNPRPVETTAP